LGLALDEPKDNDTKVEESGITFLVDNELMVSCGEIKVDFMESGMRSGFSITSKIPVAGSSDGGGCSSGSCGSGGCG
jgi:iron-sulfur cluster assembly protein